MWLGLDKTGGWHPNLSDNWTSNDDARYKKTTKKPA
jgi:hypothetical protein